MKKAAWVLPVFLEGSGGHRTMFQNIQVLSDTIGLNNASKSCIKYIFFASPGISLTILAVNQAVANITL